MISGVSYEERCEIIKRAYKGESKVKKLKGTPFENYTTIDWIRYFIDHYGGFDGAHHKDWVLDQVMRISYGTPVEVYRAIWDSSEYKNEEFHVRTGNPTQEYNNYVSQYDDSDYSVGVAP